jgi:murein DD-endopeptidase MepM/ murein hydrolase activator NlpD
VVGAVDGVPEREWLHVLRESWIALRTTIEVSRGRGPIDPERLAGNHVIVRADGVFALYAHLAPGSVAVTAGQRVAVGEVIGRVGHTGNSTAPHLHFQLMDSGDAPRAHGVACAFESYAVRRDGHWQPVHHEIPARGERVRWGS